MDLVIVVLWVLVTVVQWMFVGAEILNPNSEYKTKVSAVTDLCLCVIPFGTSLRRMYVKIKSLQ